MAQVLEQRPGGTSTALDAATRSLALDGFRCSYGSRDRTFPQDRVWAAFRELGTGLWLDTGDLDEAQQIWTREFTHLTTNNTLVNKEVQKGLFDGVILEAGRRLREAAPEVDSERLVQEVAYVLNCRVALRLVAAFDAHVSVELHPGIAHNLARTMEYARRYYSVNPERFLIKVPLTPTGYVAVNQLHNEGIPVNFTLGFSARQNYLAAVVSRPAFVNVFMGRLNSFVADSGLGDGKYVGEKTTLATQLALWRLRDSGQPEVSCLIGASTREPEQLLDLAGLDVFTIPPKVAQALHERLSRAPVRLTCCAEKKFEVKLGPGVPAEAIGLNNLWDVSEPFVRAVRRLSQDAGALSSPERFVAFLAEQGFGSLFRNWSPEELQQIREDGKIPRYERWKDQLRSGEVALDDLMTVSALQSFAQDQQALDDRIRDLLK